MPRELSMLCTVVLAFGIVAHAKEFQKESSKKPNSPERKPIVVVPGVLGSRLQAKLNLTESPGLFCSRVRDWFDIWLNIDELVPLFINCWVYDISMHYTDGNRKPTNQKGVKTRTIDFGGTKAFEYLDSDPYAPGSPYFNKFVDYLVKLGYKISDDLKGAPYDWRLSPSLEDTFLSNLTKLIEDNYYQHFNRKVVIIGHSMGNMFVYYYLKRQPQAWKDKFVDSFISINSPYLGSVKAIKSVLSGETEGHDVVLPRLKMRTASRTWPSSFFLLPRPSLWPKNKSVVVSTFKQNFTVHDYKAIFETIKCEKCWERFEYYGAELGDLSAPNVEVHCVYSSQLPTAEVLLYDSELFPDASPVLKTGSGDGTVNTFSSSYCLNWRKEQSQPVHDVLLPGNNHVDILSNITLLEYIRGVVVSESPKLTDPHHDLL